MYLWIGKSTFKFAPLADEVRQAALSNEYGVLRTASLPAATGNWQPTPVAPGEIRAHLRLTRHLVGQASQT